MVAVGQSFSRSVHIACVPGVAAGACARSKRDKQRGMKPACGLFTQMFLNVKTLVGFHLKEFVCE